MKKNNVELTLSNPGVGAKFFVIGSLSFYGNTVRYQVYSDTVFSTRAYKKVFRYNYMVKDFEIAYDKIRKVRGGFLLLFLVHRKVIVKLDDKIKHKFLAARSRDRREILEFLTSKIK